MTPKYNKLACNNYEKCKVQLSKSHVAKKVVDAIDKKIKQQYDTIGFVFKHVDWARKVDRTFFTEDRPFYSGHSPNIWGDTNYFSEKYGLSSSGPVQRSSPTSSSRPRYPPPYMLPGYWIGKMIKPPPGFGPLRPPPSI